MDGGKERIEEMGKLGKVGQMIEEIFNSRAYKGVGIIYKASSQKKE